MNLNLQGKFLSLLGTAKSVVEKRGKKTVQIDNDAYRTSMQKTAELQEQKDIQRQSIITPDTTTSMGRFDQLDPKVQNMIKQQLQKEAKNG